ncbi:DNA adenine methylase [candidate division KSB1 bacterium]|nr:DNA adenine methylase [candidate division KSB1 bacterium]
MIIKFVANQLTISADKISGQQIQIIIVDLAKYLFLEFETVADLFSGTGAVSYLFKLHGKSITYNDILKSNYYIGEALIENGDTRIDTFSIRNILNRKNDNYQTIIADHFKDIFDAPSENTWLDRIVQNIYFYFDGDESRKAVLFWAFFQACIIKRPFNLFHCKNLYMRTKDVKRTFGNKISWVKPFDDYFLKFAQEINHAIFDNGRHCRATRGDQIDSNRKHHPLKSKYNRWVDKSRIRDTFIELIDYHKKSHIIISYRNDGIPPVDESLKLVRQFKRNWKVVASENYKYVLSTNHSSRRFCSLVGTDAWLRFVCPNVQLSGIGHSMLLYS